MKKAKEVIDVLLYVMIIVNIVSSVFLADNIAEETNYIVWAAFMYIILYTDTSKGAAK